MWLRERCECVDDCNFIYYCCYLYINWIGKSNDGGEELVIYGERERDRVRKMDR